MGTEIAGGLADDRAVLLGQSMKVEAMTIPPGVRGPPAPMKLLTAPGLSESMVRAWGLVHGQVTSDLACPLGGLEGCALH